MFIALTTKVKPNINARYCHDPAGTELELELLVLQSILAIWYSENQTVLFSLLSINLRSLKALNFKISMHQVLRISKTET